jgi:prolyl-tRNA synthetase
MQDLGVIHQASTGVFHLLPLGERSLQKLINIVDDEMSKINAQKLLLPLLTPGELWKITGMARHEQVLTLFPNQETFLFTRHFSTSETANYPQHWISCTPAFLLSYNINRLKYCP